MTLNDDPEVLLAALAAVNATIAAILGGQIISVWMRAQDLLMTYFRAVLHTRAAAAQKGRLVVALKSKLDYRDEDGGADHMGPASAARNEVAAEVEHLKAEVNEGTLISKLIKSDVNEMYRLSLMGLGIMGWMTVTGVIFPLLMIATGQADPLVIDGATWLTLTAIWAVVVYVWRTVIGSWDLSPSEAMRKVVQEDTGVDDAGRMSRAKDGEAVAAIAVGAIVLLVLLALL